MPRTTLTILSPYVPYPPHSGALAHMMQLSRNLAHYFDLSLLALADDPASVGWGPLADVCAEVAAFRRRPKRSLSLNPPAVWMERSPDLEAELRRRWKAQPPRLVQLEFTTMARYAALARRMGAVTICTVYLVGFVSQVRRARLERSPALRLRRLAGALSFWQFELRTLAQCDLAVTLGDTDAQALRRWLPGLPIATIPSGVDLAEWPPLFNPLNEDRVLFVGNFQHPPNLEGALWLVREVWPLVLKQHPTAQLTLAGRSPPGEILALAGPGVQVPGTLDDLRPLYAQASLFVAPIFWGAGIRIKLLEALASGLPIVTTRLAAEGLNVSRSALFAERPQEWAGAIVRLLSDRALRSQLGAAGPPVVRRDYDWRRLAERLAGMYEGMLAGRARRTQ
jgi:glycosyltransferase involved in cell wall biosynthesis